MIKYRSVKKFMLTRKMIVYGLLVLLILAGTVGYASLRMSKQDTTQSADNKQQPNVTTTPNPNKQTAGPSGSKQENSSFTSSGKLIAPYGTFVSNHQPLLNSSSPRNKVESVCTTSPGAKCSILFTKGGITKLLEEKITDANGVATWSWTPQGIGLTQGQWAITAKAVSGSQISTSKDNIVLEVGP